MKPQTRVIAVGPERPNPEWPRAVLVRVDGELRCRCPYACMATFERCEFAEQFEEETTRKGRWWHRKGTR